MARREADALDGAMAAKGIAITPPGATMVAPCRSAAGVRLCLGAPALADLRTALSEVAACQRQASAGAQSESLSLAAGP
jgi:DNA-binding transcriptional MocR family regulator